MVNVNKLKGKIVECEMSVEEVAEAINVNSSTLYRKLAAGGEGITIGEAGIIAEVLSLTCAEATAIFFAQYVA